MLLFICIFGIAIIVELSDIAGVGSDVCSSLCPMATCVPKTLSISINFSTPLSWLGPHWSRWCWLHAWVCGGFHLLVADELEVLICVSWLPGNVEQKRVVYSGNADGRYGFSSV